ncbi:MAG: hypothetical protein ABEL76_13830 [Bradymonadaceae bacterium]
MANVNFAELRASLRDCVEFCREHEDRSYCERFLPKIEDALDSLQESKRESDASYAEWRAERRGRRKAWKELSKQLKEAQRKLDGINAVGFPTEEVRYWDEDRLQEIVEEMRGYLDARTDAIDFAEDLSDRLQRKLDAAIDETDDEYGAVDSYSRQAKLRSKAFGSAVQVLSDFREALREELGQDHPEYTEIRWPYTVAPDDTTL